MALLPKSKLWRTIIIVLGVSFLLVAFFYAEEDLRGWMAWERCKHELAAKGEVLDWDKYIPPPVPDDQNFFKAPNMAEWFVRNNSPSAKQTSLSQHLAYPSDLAKQTASNGPVEAARIFIVPENNSSNVLQFDDAATGRRVREIIEDAIGDSSMGSQGLLLTAKKLNQIRPVEIRLQADKIPSADEVAGFFDAGITATNIGPVRVERGIDQNMFRVLLVPKASISAADYLAWGEQAGPDFDLIREALKRPYARMDGDYSKPSEIPIPNFIIVRNIAQTLAQRAQCDLLLGQPDKALQELTLLHDMRHLLEAAPSGKPMTLVAAMINVAVTGLYVDTISGGFQYRTWQEPQLAMLQEQLADINLTPFVFAALQEEPAGECRTFIAYAGEIMKDTSDPKRRKGLLGKLKDPFWRLYYVDPRGWIYQNMVNVAVLQQKPLDGFDLAHDTVAPSKIDEASLAVEKFVARGKSPYKLLAAIATPNYSRAEQTTAHNQTMVNEAQIACALERYRLAHGDYPETLDALSPQFMETLPHDLIGGQPLIYRPTADGKFLLYSIGWNEKDDDGKSGGTGADYTKGDWVWKN